jgi:hypothetical protein
MSSQLAARYVDTFDITEMPCVLFQGDDRCACSALASRWVTAKGGTASARVLGSEEKLVTGATWRKFPHRTNHNYIEADMYSGNAGEKAAFVEQVTNSFSMPHASQRKHVLVLHNIDYLPQRTLASVCDAVLPHGVIIATASNGAALPEKLRSRAVILRVACEMGVWPEAEKLAETLIKSKGTPEDCRAFAHKGMKLSCPTSVCFRALLARVSPPDHDILTMAADLEHRARLITLCPHAIELFAMEVYDRCKRVRKKPTARAP